MVWANIAVQIARVTICFLANIDFPFPFQRPIKVFPRTLCGFQKDALDGNAPLIAFILNLAVQSNIGRTSFRAV